MKVIPLRWVVERTFGWLMHHRRMVSASALDGVARNPALPTPLLLRLLAFDGAGDGPPRHALQRAGLPQPAIAVILAHPCPGARIEFAMSTRAEPAQRARLADDPSPKVRAALVRTRVARPAYDDRTAADRRVRPPARRPRPFCSDGSAGLTPYRTVVRGLLGRAPRSSSTPKRGSRMGDPGAGRAVGAAGRP
ncbi:hypothetical protein GCM10010215_65430 [Streptomyces virginiae]|uniref:Transposase DDE domain-containing protein n=1 Tax=Streptomyces virginiae TaxID=1961 RepID=A0ABQ3NMR7_STRVG|nr:hypothetical protein GCM10010215_65430 [Streptomyces virginiae]GHI14063.1 hypothetical protein Scinn_35260 [Streptomyces virginiae]